uniref:Uncharacterized protein n=1 Tax=Quercus lobata TaxID=97700 RepID=A0A7N2MVR1_QUELO
MFFFMELLSSLKPLFTAVIVIVLSPIVQELTPSVVKNYLVSICGKYFFTPQLTLLIEEKCGISSNQIYEAAATYLRSKIGDSSNLNRLRAIQEARRVVKLYSCEFESVQTVREGYSIILEHPATFEKLAMDPELKRILKEDLDRFVKRKEWYKKVGRAWKRGTKSDSDLRRILLSISNRSMMSTLSGLLNVIDGLWSNNGNGRIIVFTTNHKDQLDQLDPALLRSGRMDMRVNMSYCSMYGFKQLASTYLDINGDHQLYGQIEPLFEKVEVTPAEIAEELSRTEDTDFALRGVVELLEEKTKKKELENAMSM